MSLEITHRQRDGIEILDLNGSLTLGPTDLAFRIELDSLVKTGKNRVLLNLGELRRLDTTGLGTLLFALSELRNAGGNLAILNLKTSGLEALTDAHLEAVFQVFRDEQDALNSFFPDRATNHYDVLEFVKSNSNSSSDH